ncbi:MAG: hypothetical protein ACHP9Z_21185 [Streptosporangiales bacterium]
MAMMLGIMKRLLLGRPVRSDHLGHALLPKRIALPVFASDALSSVAYATEEILIVLSVGGIALFHYTRTLRWRWACSCWSRRTGRTCMPTRPAAGTTRWPPPTSGPGWAWSWLAP